MYLTINLCITGTLTYVFLVDEFHIFAAQILNSVVHHVDQSGLCVVLAVSS